MAISLPPKPYRPGQMEVYFLDVGHGDSELMVFPGGDALLVDGGGASFSDFEIGRRLVLPFIIQKKIRVRWAAVSHYHPDHVRGLAEIIGILKPDELWIASVAWQEPLFLQLLNAAKKHTTVRKISRGFAKKINGCCIRCLAPPRFISNGLTDNNFSMVLQVDDTCHSFLFSGDIEAAIEAELTAYFGKTLKSTVLKISHHGSRSSSSAYFMNSVKPGLAVISCAFFNHFNFPNPEVLQRLKAIGCCWLTTARRGGIKMVSHPSGLEIEVSQ